MLWRGQPFFCWQSLTEFSKVTSLPSVPSCQWRLSLSASHRTWNLASTAARSCFPLWYTYTGSYATRTLESFDTDNTPLHSTSTSTSAAQIAWGKRVVDQLLLVCSISRTAHAAFALLECKPIFQSNFSKIYKNFHISTNQTTGPFVNQQNTLTMTDSCYRQNIQHNKVWWGFFGFASLRLLLHFITLITISCCHLWIKEEQNLFKSLWHYQFIIILAKLKCKRFQEPLKNPVMLIAVPNLCSGLKLITVTGLNPWVANGF